MFSCLAAFSLAFAACDGEHHAATANAPGVGGGAGVGIGGDAGKATGGRAVFGARASDLQGRAYVVELGGP